MVGGTKLKRPRANSGVALNLGHPTKILFNFVTYIPTSRFLILMRDHHNILELFSRFLITIRMDRKDENVKNL